MHNRSYYIVNSITAYRAIAALAMLLLLCHHQFTPFKWLLVISFCTDAVDGYLARRYNVISKFGSSLDSVADDLTIAVAIIGMVVLRPHFFKEEIVPVIVLSALYFFQIIVALIRYHKISSFHTYIAKAAAVLQGIFLILFFFLPGPVYFLFYLMAIITTLDLVEEIALVLILPRWQANVKGLYWLVSKKINF